MSGLSRAGAYARKTLGLALRDVIINGVVASPLIPSILRTYLLRAYGVKVRTYNVQSKCFFGGNNAVIGRAYINYGAFLDCSARISIGDGTRLGPQCTLITLSHKIGDSEATRTDRSPGTAILAPIDIGDNVWLGARVTILPGVTIGNGCVVAAGSVVTKNLAPNGLYGGVPARLLRFLEDDQPSSAPRPLA